MQKFPKVALIIFFSMMMLGSVLFPIDNSELALAAEVSPSVRYPLLIAQTGTFSYFVYLPVIFKPTPPPTPTPSPTPMPTSTPLPTPMPTPTSPPSTSNCPTTSTRSYNLVPVPGSPADRADFVHGDLNLSLRGWETNTNTALTLVNYTGGTDGDAPQIKGVFTDGRVPTFTSAHRVYDWNWGCTNDINGDGLNDGCRGGLLNTWDATLLGMQTTAGEALRIPSRNADIYQGNYRTLVLYAEEERLTIVYVREDSVAHAYAVHFENVCVDPNLLALYRSRVDADGWRINSGGYQLPALNNGQPFGTALGDEILIAIRDRGAFMDPRSQKDWWK